ncbi:c9e574ea-84a3-4549-acb4-eb3f21e0ba14 [Thermothielavioides terrestris]|uniref:TBP-associated factor 6 n=2 Tax=Thermothielavioides terrestris TaxID=2587410 RepID=G2QV62_THETT|nr:TAF6-like protein [Thermothielavioides terrestris NRRL 8126]AEO62949.1 TAF6-like protein [Thermothielavioides terrestris NRRL 8126]SPQ21558.1 c9e574ea-84a3-4549-acb4-eb3f21e0ba14 [Thermothielavioides terrestris]
MAGNEGPKLLWNPDNVRDVADSQGITLSEEPLRVLAQDVEYRIGQLIVEALRFMRAANRTTLTVQDVSLALRVLKVEPLYGYESTRPLRYGEASLGPGQPLFYIDDEEIDFEKVINAPLPKVPRDMSFTAHWLAVEGVQPSIPQNPTTAETSSKDLLPKGPGANPALAALAGNDNVSFRPSVKHVISKELILYFDKIQAAILDDDPDEEKTRLREAALESVRSDPGLHQLLPYFVNFITNQVTHHLDDLFVLRQMMELAEAVIQNPSLFLDPYASALSAPVLTCLMARKLGGAAPDEGGDALREQYRLRELAASLLEMIARKYGASNALLRPKLTRTCLKHFLDPTRPPAVLFGAIRGVAASGGPEAVRILVLPNLKSFDAAVLQPLQEKAEGPHALELEMLLGGIMKAVESIVLGGGIAAANGVNGADLSREAEQVTEFLGPIIGQRVARLGNHALNRAILEVRHLD